MSEGLYRGQQAVRRLFGTSARIAGTAGSGRGPGCIEIWIGSALVGRGRSLQEALADARRHQRETCLPSADVQLI